MTTETAKWLTKTFHSKRAPARWTAVACLAAGLLSCRGTPPAEGATDGAASVQAPAGRVINVEITTLVPMDFSETFSFTGVAEANRDARISAEEAGPVRELFVSEGSRVEAGDTLLKIDDRVLASQVEQARAAAELATETWTRTERLYEEESIGSELDYLNAKFAAEQAAAALQALAVRLDRTNLRAPFAGIVDELDIELGESVSPGQPVIRLVDLSRVKVVAGVPERFAPDVRPGSRATITFDVLAEPFDAAVVRVGQSIDPGNRTFDVEMRLANRDGRIRPEMLARIVLDRRTIPNAIVAPRDAVLRSETGYIAYVAVSGEDRGEIAEARSVTVGPSSDVHAVVESGLAEGDRLVVVGHRALADGDRVNVVGERE